MKLSDKTLSVLKSFATLNKSIVFKPGNIIRTITPEKTVIASATIPDEIPSDAVIYDLSRFLSIYNLYEDPDIQFKDTHFVISEGKRKTKYLYADVSMVMAPPEKEVNFPTADFDVDVKWDDLQAVQKAAVALQFEEIAITGEDGTCYIRAIDSKNPSADTFAIDLGETDHTFSFIIKIDNLRLIVKKSLKIL